jgi:epoxyqueuosine reductase
MLSPFEAVTAGLEGLGYRARQVNIQRLAELKQDLQNFREQGFFDRDFYQERLSGFEIDSSLGGLDARSVIVVAIPQPQYRFSFETASGIKSLIVPPTYLFEERIDGQVKGSLAAMLEPYGYSVAFASLPKKLLAVRSGLGAYGRNNICYVDGMGSFLRLVAFVSDLPCPEDDWGPPAMMPACERCNACQKHCPSGAIAGDRFLLHAERCLTYHNEKPGDLPFAGWLQPDWHNSLVGCMRCQVVCPQNKLVKDWIVEGATFSAGETGLLMRRTPLDRLPDGLRQKLEEFDLFDLLESMPRNLSACGVGI